ncbi:glycosyltransferase family 4 protein [Natrinema versiforme]|nr:glycosyltransferase family 4 protein [Natrinema versiforme]
MLVDISGESGQNLYSRQIANALSRIDGVQLTIICPTPSNDPPEVLSSDNVTPEYITEKRRRDPAWHISAQPEILRKLRKIQKNNNIDGIVCSLKVSLLTPPFYSYSNDIPQILLVEGLMEKTISRMSPFIGASLLARIIATINAKNSTYTFAAYEEAKEWIQSRGNIADDSIEIFHHGVDTNQFSPVPRSAARERIHEPIDDEDFVITFVGSFKQYHCLEPLLEAIDRLDEDVKLLLVGDGPMLDKTKSLAHDLNIDSYFPGFIDHNQVNIYISASDLAYGVIDPDHWGSPMKVFEYLSCGVPVIATKSTELEFIGTHDLGELINDSSPDSIRSAIEVLIDLPIEERNQMGNRGREYSIENRTWDTLAENIVKKIGEYHD